MKFTGKEDHSISLESASQWTKNFRTTAAKEAVLGGFFGKDAMETLLAQKGAVGFRYYYALDDNEQPVLVLVGVDEDGNDLYDGALMEVSRPCPPYCSAANPLNS